MVVVVVVVVVCVWGGVNLRSESSKLITNTPLTLVTHRGERCYYLELGSCWRQTALCVLPLQQHTSERQPAPQLQYKPCAKGTS
jgi:hypothetical protein